MSFAPPPRLALVLAALVLAPAALAQSDVDGVVINEILAHPATFDTNGDGTVDGGDEFVELYNASDTPVDLDGFEIWDDGGKRHDWDEDGPTLAPGGYLVVVASHPAPPPGTVVASTGALGFEDDGDTVYLRRNDAELFLGGGPGVFVAASYEQDVPNNPPPGAVTGAESFGNDGEGLSAQRSPDGSTTFRAAAPTPAAQNVIGAPGLIIVTKPTDDLVVDGECSFREAVLAAALNEAVDGCQPGTGGVDTIVFSASFTIELTSPIFLEGNLLLVGNRVIDVLTGESRPHNPNNFVPGMMFARRSGRSGLAANPLLIVQGENVTIEGVVIRDNATTGAGGGIRVESGAALTLVDSQVLNNGAADGGGIHNAGTLTLTNSTVNGNSATGQGGGVYNVGTLTVAGSTVSQNASEGFDGGGGIYTFGTLSVIGSVLAENTAVYGGAIGTAGAGSVTVTSSEIRGNTVTDWGGGIFTNGGSLAVVKSAIHGNSASVGGGVFNSGTASVSRSTISGNGGFGIHNVFRGSVAVSHTTIAGNGGGIYDEGSRDYDAEFPDDSPPRVTLRSTVLASSQGAPNVVHENQPLGSQGHNVCDDGCAGVLTGPEDLPTVDPELGPLASNGGPTPTHALLDGSPALDVGGTCGPTDQRGEMAPSGSACDAGAFELQVEPAALACSQAAPLSFDADGAGGVAAADFSTEGTERAGIRNEGDDPVDLSGCSFVTYDPFTERALYATAMTGTVAPGGVYVLETGGGDQPLPPGVFFDDPGAFALAETAPDAPQAGDPVSDVFGRVVAAVVYDRSQAVYGSTRGGLPPDQAQAQDAAFAAALAQVFGRATLGEGGAKVDLAVAAWPNPTRGAATVAFGLAQDGAVRVSVVDVLGREVAVVADRPFAAGRHAVAVPPLAAGAYIVCVASEGGVRTSRLTVAR